MQFLAGGLPEVGDGGVALGADASCPVYPVINDIRSGFPFSPAAVLRPGDGVSCGPLATGSSGFAGPVVLTQDRGHDG
jgi:hypothetical protein